MNISKISGVKVESICSCIPGNTIINRDFAQTHFSEDLNSTILALGIEERHVCRLDTTTSLDLCVFAAKKLFESGVSNKEIGAVVFVTQTPDYLMPNNASFAHYQLNLPNDAFSFDINHACSGYIIGLWNAALIANSLKKKVLLLDGDTNSRYVSPWDKSTALLFGDGGTASIISPSQDVPDWSFALNTDGTDGNSVIMGLGFRRAFTAEAAQYETFPDGSKRRPIDMYMDGVRVFDYAVQEVPKIVNDFMYESETSPEDYEKLISHQPNSFMLRKIAKKTGFPKEKVPLTIQKYGNTGSVSIPLTICSELKNESPGRVLLISIGAGMTTGVGDISLRNLNNLGVFEMDL